MSYGFSALRWRHRRPGVAADRQGGGTPAARAGLNLDGVKLQVPWLPGAVCGMGRLGPTSTQSILFKHTWALICDSSSAAVDPGLLVSSLSVNILLESLHISEWRRWSPLSSWANILGRLWFLWEAVFRNITENHSQYSKLGECGNLSLMVGGWLVVWLAPLHAEYLHVGAFNKFLHKRYFVKTLLLLELAWYFKAVILFVYLCLNVCM